ncbi:TauD/TfdA family dioxygenase [Candidatus Peregrinibacteria bacterium]|nr:MAG: TauD/TfdA family dioxygenase [Candidatus Peregrinibacteria bacterium]
MRILEGNNIFSNIQQLPPFLGKEDESNIMRQQELGMWINSQSVQFGELAEQIKEGVHCTNSTPVVLKNTGIQSVSKESRTAIMIGFSTLLGRPTPTDKRNKKVAWPISVPKNADKINFRTFSEHNQEAKLHTDSQYLQCPEQAISLWSIHPDGSGEGLSYCASAQDILHEMTAHSAGQESLQILQREDVPFRVPSSFMQDPNSNQTEVIFGKIFGQNPVMRYREDTIHAGYDAINQIMPPEIEKALQDISTAMNKVQSDFFLLEAGDVLWINNHDHLHARTPFSDLERLLFRIRYNFSQQ